LLVDDIVEGFSIVVRDVIEEELPIAIQREDLTDIVSRHAFLRIDEPHNEDGDLIPCIGTVILTAGGQGNTSMYDLAHQTNPVYFDLFLNELHTNGFRTVDVRWHVEWHRPPPQVPLTGGIWAFPASQTYGSCYMSQFYAILVRYLHRMIDDSNHLLMAQGNCAGAAQIAFGLCYHGLDEILDLVNLSSAMPPCPRYPLDRIAEAIPSDVPLENIETESLRDIINSIVSNLEGQIARAEIDVEQLWCYLAIRGLERVPRTTPPGWISATPIGHLEPDAGRAWALEAEPILLRNPTLDYPTTEVHFFLAQHEGLPFIHEMTMLLYERMQPSDRTLVTLTTRIESSHLVYLSEEGATAMLQTIFNRAGMP
jgi:hypothetical protein